MKMKVRMFTPEPKENPTRYQVGFDVELDNGTEVYSPTTVYVSTLPADYDEITVIQLAQLEVLPGLRILNSPALSEAFPPSTFVGTEIEVPDHSHEDKKGHTH